MGYWLLVMMLVTYQLQSTKKEGRMGKAIEDLQVLQTAEDVCDAIWTAVIRWGDFARDSVGKQMVRSADSVGANIAEAYGRFHYGERLQFLYYARGSVFETKYWLNRVYKRGLLPKNEVEQLINRVTLLARQLNGFLAHIKRERKTTKSPSILRESFLSYEISQLEQEDVLFSDEDLTYLQNIEADSLTITNNQ